MRIVLLLILSLACCALTTCLSAAPAAAQEQRSKPRIEVLMHAESPGGKALIQGLRELGYVDGDSIAIEWRGAAATQAEWGLIAKEVALSKPDIVIAGSTPAARAVLAGTTVPVVFIVGDPVAAGLATSLARPGGNGTGVSLLTPQLTAKRLELLRLAVPRAQRIIFVMNSSNPNDALQLKEVREAARALDLELVIVDVQPGAIDAGLSKMQSAKGSGILIAADLFFLDNRAKIARAVLKSKLPAIFPATEYHDAGVLMSYGPNLALANRRLAAYVDKILKGAKPSELPIEQLAEYELVIDLRVARSIGHQVPQELLLRADEILR